MWTAAVSLPKCPRLMFARASFFCLLFISPDVLFAKEVRKNLTTRSSQGQPSFNQAGSVHQAETKTSSPKSPGMVDEYLSHSNLNYTLEEHILLNAFAGLIMGGIQGVMAGFTDFDASPATSDGQFNTLALTASIFASVGFLSGIGVALWEHSREEQLTIGPTIIKYTTYGAFSGVLLGSGIGAILFASSNNTNDVINWASYGAIAGISVGLAAYFIFDAFSAPSLTFDLGYDPVNQKYYFSVNRVL